MPGPMPERSDMRVRRNKTEETDTAPADDITWPAPMQFWHPLAVEWYESLQKPAIAMFLQQTDVAQARILCQVLTDQLERQGGISAAALPGILSGMADLLTTEGARRRLRIEIERREETDAAPVLDIVDRRNALKTGS